jgi:hypothetical protein
MRKKQRSGVTDDYSHGRRDGLRLALAVLAAEEANWASLLGESSSCRTNATREIRHKTLQMAQTWLRTALNRITPKGGASIVDEELAGALKETGLERGPSPKAHLTIRASILLSRVRLQGCDDPLSAIQQPSRASQLPSFVHVNWLSPGEPWRLARHDVE